MTGPHKEPCPVCKGVGIVPHDRRRMDNGELDPADFKRHEICAKYGGGGRVLTNLKAIEERKPSFIADAI